jgi:glycosyltransferase involved in cell wall biosynthesis
MSRVLVIIPAFNEEATIAGVIREIQSLKAGYVIVVVNDGSTDGTYEEAKKEGALVIPLPINVGIGAAMQTGFHYAAEKGYDLVAQVDGDGQHPARELPKLIDMVEHGGADVAIGSRFLERRGFQSTFIRRVGIRYFELLHRMLTRVRVTDSTSGFRALNRRALGIADRYYPDEYPEAESIVLFSLNSLRIREVPVSMRERQGGESSIRGFARSVYYMVKVTLAIVFAYLRLNNRRM